MIYDFLTLEASRFPMMVVVSVTNVCNYRCTHCFHPTYSEQADFKGHHMESAVFRKIADELGQHPHSILRFIAWGEPLLHPRLVEFTRYARSVAPRNKITLITNGYLLTVERSRALMEAGLDMVEVSLDAATPTTYRKVRVAPDPDPLFVVEKNVQDMVTQRDAGSFRTKVAVSFVMWPTEESEAEFAVFHRKWGEKVDAVVKRPLHTFKGAVQQLRPLPQPRQPCYGLWARCNINPWGQVSVCYNDWENKYLLGDLREPGITIARIWQGSQLAGLRAEQCQGIFSGCCATCHDYNPFAWQHPYEEVVARCFPD